MLSSSRLVWIEGEYCYGNGNSTGIKKQGPRSSSWNWKDECGPCLMPRGSVAAFLPVTQAGHEADQT